MHAAIEAREIQRFSDSAIQRFRPETWGAIDMFGIGTNELIILLALLAMGAMFAVGLTVAIVLIAKRTKR